jgi:RNA polymerase sigma-70 factor (ECF subfamily)
MTDQRADALASIDDHALVQSAMTGDCAAFGELIRRHWDRCVDVGCYYLRNRGDAEDQAQNAILKAFQHLDQYHGEAEFATWLTRIVVNQCLMLFRSRRRTRFLYLDDACGTERAARLQVAVDGNNPEREIAQQEITNVLRREIRRIPHLLREVMVLRDVQELPMVDVADQLGITVSAAKSRLVRARAELRQRMSRHHTTATKFYPRKRITGLVGELRVQCALPA